MFGGGGLSLTDPMDLVQGGPAVEEETHGDEEAEEDT